MSDNKHESESHMIGADKIREHQLFVMVALAIFISFFLVFVALSLYRSSGTVQLDLSRPGYDSVREEVTKGTEVFKAYPGDGEINSESLNKFDELYKAKSSEALMDANPFSGDALSDEALSLN